jgi:hypothetical protein
MHAESGRESALTMQDIAYRTEQETFSMRVITVVALVFLPPTFVAVGLCAKGAQLSGVHAADIQCFPNSHSFKAVF